MARPVGVGALLCLGVLGLAFAFLSTSDPGAVVPYRLGAHWLGGALHGLGPSLTPGLFSSLTIAMFVAYAFVVGFADSIPLSWAIGVAVLLDLAFTLTPLLLSSDVVGYLVYARLGAVHGIDPYLYGLAKVPLDPLFRFARWRSFPTAYGPLFTLGSYAIGSFGVIAAIWVFKVIAGASALASTGVTWLAGGKSRGAARPIMLLSLNPLLMIWGVGGGHNDLMAMLLVLVAVLLMSVGRERVGAATGVAVAAIKLSVGLFLPFAVAGAKDRRRCLTSAILAFLVAAVASVVIFGHGMVGYIDALHSLAQRAGSESFPGWWARHLGLINNRSGVTPGSRDACALVFVIAACVLLVRTWRGANWIAAAGWASLVFLLTTTWFWPWYIAWLLPFAALGKDSRLQVAAVAFTGWAVLVQATSGIG
jgi:hypothetical protein